jgi:hypothetical protein
MFVAAFLWSPDALTLRSEGMSATPLNEVPNNRLFHKLNPSRFPRMTSFMAAVVGYLLDVRFVSPAIEEIAVTSDGFVLVRADGDTRTIFAGEFSDFVRNWYSLLTAAGLNTAERIEAESLFASKIGYFGGHREN